MSVCCCPDDNACRSTATRSRSALLSLCSRQTLRRSRKKNVSHAQNVPGAAQFAVPSQRAVLHIGQTRARAAAVLDTPVRDHGLVSMPVEHFYDLKNVLAEYWNVFVRNTAEQLDPEFVEKAAPSVANIKRGIQKRLNHVRYVFGFTLDTFAVEGDDTDDDVGVTSDTNDDTISLTPTAEKLPPNPKKTEKFARFHGRSAHRSCARNAARVLAGMSGAAARAGAFGHVPAQVRVPRANWPPEMPQQQFDCR